MTSPPDEPGRGDRRLDDPAWIDEIVANARRRVSDGAPGGPGGGSGPSLRREDEPPRPTDRAPEPRATPRASRAPEPRATPGASRAVEPRATPGASRAVEPRATPLRSTVLPDPHEHPGPDGEEIDDSELLDEPDPLDDSVSGVSPVPAARSGSNRRLRSLIEWVVVVGGALVVALLIKTFLFQAFYIPSESMEPTLGVGDRVIVNKLSDGTGRGDLIVFEKPPGEGQAGIKDLIKRVVALPGETISARDNQVFIDDGSGPRPLEEPYLPDGSVTPDFEPVPVPDGHVFVMGDNRSDSRDSRFFGSIPEEDIVGRAFVRVWPPSAVGFL